jgi:hypothetical protein
MPKNEVFEMDLDGIRSEIEHMRRQILRQRREIQSLQRAGINTAAADALLHRMQNKVDALCQERGRLLGEIRLTSGPRKYHGTNKVILGTPASRRV